MVKNPPAMQETWVQSLGLGRSSGEGNGYALQYSGLESSLGRRAWQAIQSMGWQSQTPQMSESPFHQYDSEINTFHIPLCIFLIFFNLEKLL